MDVIFIKSVISSILGKMCCLGVTSVKNLHTNCFRVFYLVLYLSPLFCKLFLCSGETLYLNIMIMLIEVLKLFIQLGILAWLFSGFATQRNSYLAYENSLLAGLQFKQQ